MRLAPQSSRPGTPPGSTGLTALRFPMSQQEFVCGRFSGEFDTAWKKNTSAMSPPIIRSRPAMTAITIKDWSPFSGRTAEGSQSSREVIGRLADGRRPEFRGKLCVSTEIAPRAGKGYSGMGFVERERDRINVALACLKEPLTPEDETKYQKLYAAQQALSWALEPSGIKSPYDLIMDIHRDLTNCRAKRHPVQS